MTREEAKKIKEFINIGCNAIELANYIDSLVDETVNHVSENITKSCKTCKHDENFRKKIGTACSGCMGMDDDEPKNWEPKEEIIIRGSSLFRMDPKDPFEKPTKLQECETITTDSTSTPVKPQLPEKIYETIDLVDYLLEIQHNRNTINDLIDYLKERE